MASGKKLPIDDRIFMMIERKEGPRLAIEADHSRSEENNLDPDDGNSWSCSVCNLPIFSTPFITSYIDNDNNNNKVIYLHDQCANLPKELQESDLHPKETLLLKEQKPSSSTTTCAKCKKGILGTVFYSCAHSDCSIKLDVLCATTIKILHRSHEHRLTAIRAGASASFICGACGTRHDQKSSSSSDVINMCNACGFWIHEQCASLPNVIVVLQHENLDEQHEHPLLLYYSRPGQDSRTTTNCRVCKGKVESLGVYSCVKCPDYNVHIMCAVADPRTTFKPVLIREARLPDVVSLPISDANTSVVRYITDNTTLITSSSSNSSGDNQLHEHPLILYVTDDIINYDNDDDDDDRPSYLCNACVQSISPPFYKCDQCPNFFLHDCCAHLLRALAQHPAHKHHPLSLLPKVSTSKFVIPLFLCRGCQRPTDGFAYSCQACNDDFNLDVSCALMPASITHDAHQKTHILHSLFLSRVPYRRRGIDLTRWQKCDCCATRLAGISYECRTCHNFRLHAKCALLPDTIRHKFDQHPLKLITTTARSKSSGDQKQLICEDCEGYIDKERWYYSCNECDQSLHVECIPRLDFLSKIKFGVSRIRVECHECPLTLVRGFELSGYRCGYCGDIFSREILMFECSKCYFWIHEKCARKCLRQS